MNDQRDIEEVIELTPEQESFWHGKVMELVRRHKLGYLGNPGGGQFINNQKNPGIDIQVCDWDSKEVYDGLIAGLRKLNLEPSEANQP
jgi:hypothetical protein